VDAPAADASNGDAPSGPEAEAEEPAKVPASERRRAAEALVAIWTDLARDLALCAVDRPGDVRELGLLDETRTVAARLAPEAITAYLDRLGRASVLLRGNVSPGLVLDDLAVAWPRPLRPAA
jgi:hypothetical protein